VVSGLLTMSQNRPAAFSGLRMGGKYYLPCSLFNGNTNISLLEIIREKVQDGLTGEIREMQYTQCKIVGNGSFGVVFQTKLSPNGDDAAIKRVLQDKRFKVLISFPTGCGLDGRLTFSVPRIVNFKSCVLCGTRISWN